MRRALSRRYGGGAPEATPAYTPLGPPPGLSDGPLRAPPPGTLSPVGVGGAEPVSELASSSALRQTARRERASSGAPVPAASASSESDSDLSARGLNPSAVPFFLPPASSRNASGRLVRQEPVLDRVTPSDVSPFAGYEQENFTGTQGRLEIFRANVSRSPVEEEFGSVLVATQPPDSASTRYRASRDQGGVVPPQGERRRSALALAFGHWSTWARNSAQRRARVALVARQRATARLAWVAWKARADWSAHQRELRSLAFQTWRAVTQQVAQLQSLFVRGSRRRAESAFVVTCDVEKGGECGVHSHASTAVDPPGLHRCVCL